MDQETWFTVNRAAITERLNWLRDQPDGTLCREPVGDQFVVVTKTRSHIRLLLVQEVSDDTDLIQSRLDLRDPLHLPSTYSQAVMLGLAWNSRPGRIYVVGLGGGRIPMVLHHYLPHAYIECAEIEAKILKLACKFFGLQTDERLAVVIQDGRAYLADHNPAIHYDMIILDAVLSNGCLPYHLATREFYDLCKSRLSAHGLVIVNLLRGYPFYPDKIKTIQSVFDQVTICPVIGGNTVIFATQGPSPDMEELVRRARAIQTYYRLSFSLVKHALVTKSGPELGDYISGFSEAQPLIDGSPPVGYIIPARGYNGG